MVLKEARPLDPNEKFWAVMLRTRGRCWYCGARIWPSKIATAKPSIDHLNGRVNGGSDDLENLVPSCIPCNSSKCARSLNELRHNAAIRAHRMPKFSRMQIAWMRTAGVDLSVYDGFRFWFETHKCRHIHEWTVSRIRKEINKMLGRERDL